MQNILGRQLLYTGWLLGTQQQKRSETLLHSPSFLSLATPLHLGKWGQVRPLSARCWLSEAKLSLFHRENSEFPQPTIWPAPDISLADLEQSSWNRGWMLITRREAGLGWRLVLAAETSSSRVSEKTGLPKHLLRKSTLAPLHGKVVPISAEQREVITADRTRAAQMHRESPTFMEEYFNTPLGATKIPAPITLPVTKRVTQKDPNTFELDRLPFIHCNWRILKLTISEFFCLYCWKGCPWILWNKTAQSFLFHLH